MSLAILLWLSYLSPSALTSVLLLALSFPSRLTSDYSRPPLLSYLFKLYDVLCLISSWLSNEGIFLHRKLRVCRLNLLMSSVNFATSSSVTFKKFVIISPIISCLLSSDYFISSSSVKNRDLEAQRTRNMEEYFSSFLYFLKNLFVMKFSFRTNFLNPEQNLFFMLFSVLNR